MNKPDVIPTGETIMVCRDCGQNFTGNYCNNCGEKVFDVHDKSIRHFFDESFHFLTHLDNKFFRSLWLVMTKPGFVSTDISNGIRKKYFKPLNLFLIGIVLYLIFPFFNGLNLNLDYQMKEIYGELAKHMVQAKMAAKHISYEELSTRYNNKSAKFAKVILLVIIPLCSFVLSALFFRKKKFFADHLTIASEINTFFLYLMFFIFPILFLTVMNIIQLFTGKLNYGIGDDVSMPIYGIALIAYCTKAFMRFYNQKAGWAFLQALIFLVAHFYIVYTAARLILFSVVLLFI